MDLILVSHRGGWTCRIKVGMPQVLATAGGATLLAALTVLPAYTLLRATHVVPAPLAGVPGGRVAGEGPGFAGEQMHDVHDDVRDLRGQLAKLEERSKRLLHVAGYSADMWPDATHSGKPDTSAAPPAEVAALDRLRSVLDDRRLALAAIETLFALDDVRRRLLPDLLPVPAAALVSPFGWRPDPYTGEPAIHDGIDLVAEAGAPILAAAGGVVVYSDFHPQYGNMLEIDHGDSVTTRYAHAARRLAEVGEVVAKGAQIGVVGNSGRSTGVHLHFEVRRRGVPMDPAQFLRLRG